MIRYIFLEFNCWFTYLKIEVLFVSVQALVPSKFWTKRFSRFDFCTLYIQSYHFKNKVSLVSEVTFFWWSRILKNSMSYKIIVINLGVRHRNKIQLHQETKFFFTWNAWLENVWQYFRDTLMFFLSFPALFLAVNHHNNKNWVPSILKFFFASSPWKSVTNYVLEWMGLIFYMMVYSQKWAREW